MARGYAKYICAYCRQRPSIRIGDHVFARAFFAEGRRHDLPKAPACDECNNAKSKFEIYLSAVLPFGSRLESSANDAETLAVPRLKKNQKLARELAAGYEDLGDDGAGLPFDRDKLLGWGRYLPFGLLWHHRGEYMPSGYDAIAITPPDESLQQLASLLTLDGHRYDGDLGSGTFRYAGTCAFDDPAVSVWFVQLMSGLQLTGDPERPDAKVSALVIITGPPSTIENVRKVWVRQ